MPPRVVSGPRAKVSIFDPNTGKSGVIGIFSSIQWSVQYGTQPVYTLGSYAPKEIDYTHSEPVNFTMTAWRSINHGPHKDAAVPPLGLLLNHEYITVTVIDRVLDKANDGSGAIAKIVQCRITGYNTTINSRGLVEYSVTGVGIKVDDEDTINEEPVGSTVFPQT